MVQKILIDKLQSIFEEFFPSVMIQNLYPLDIFANIETNEVALDIRKHDNGERLAIPS